jgi:hypothetical protein
MNKLINANGQTADCRRAPFGQTCTNKLAEKTTIIGRVSRANNGDARPVEDLGLSPDEQPLRWIG